MVLQCGAMNGCNCMWVSVLLFTRSIMKSLQLEVEHHICMHAWPQPQLMCAHAKEVGVTSK